MDNPFQSPAVLSLCTGMRGLERGLERAIGALRTICYVENEAFVIENLVQQMEQGVLAPAPVWSNVKTFPWKHFFGKIHWITGGYPCQPFSHAGLRAGADDPRHLWPYIKSGIKKSRPVGVFFENVEGHISLGLRDVLADLRKLGYQTEVGLFSAAETGAPHRRNRIFILGLENSYLIGNGRRQLEEWLRKIEIQTPGPGELDDSSRIRHESEHEIPARGNSLEHASEGMADADSERKSQCSIVISESGEWTFNRSEGVGISNSFGAGLSKRKEQSTREEQPATERGDNKTGVLANTNFCRQQPGFFTRVGRVRKQTPWPAPPGQPQHHWEHSRIVKSRLGYAVNGYNFREDLLRMAGNAVVEQTAELAFRTLIRKFL